MGIYALGRREFAELFVNEEQSVRNHLIEAHVVLVYQRQLNNLSIQENRLRRQREKDMESLRALQQQRQRETQKRLDNAAWDYIAAVYEDRNEDFDLAPFGFEFSLGQIEVRAMELDKDLFADYEQQLREEREKLRQSRKKAA